MHLDDSMLLYVCNSPTVRCVWDPVLVFPDTRLLHNAHLFHELTLKRVREEGVNQQCPPLNTLIFLQEMLQVAVGKELMYVAVGKELI